MLAVECSSILQATPTTEVQVHETEKVYLPQKVVSISTQWGPVDVSINLAGSNIIKSIPNHEQCVRIAAHHPDTTPVQVAALARANFERGMEDGSIQLGIEFWY
eukprot:jgi/Chrzof1/14889/Cz09g19200.t1